MRKAAEVLRRRKGELMETWGKAVKREVKGAEFANDLVLLNHLPDLLEDLSELFLKFDDFDTIEEKENWRKLLQNSIGHGRHRSSSFGYTIDQIIREYIIFHKVITDALLEEEAYNPEVSQLLKYAIENSILFAAKEFNHSLEEMRQKLIRIIVHDLRNPISAAYLAVDIAEYGLGEEQYEKIRELTRSSLVRALELIESLLEIISIEAGEGMLVNFSKVDIMNFIKPLHYEASELYPSEVKLEVKGSAKGSEGVFDGAMVRRALENFLNNALKYGDRDLPITILVEILEGDINISVHNWGEPIPEKKKKVIFNFLSTSGGRGYGQLRSWGIGLALAKAVVDAHRGKLSLESDKENGTTFSMTLPKFRNKPGRTKVSLNI